jgi:hypothetical protein
MALDTGKGKRKGIIFRSGTVCEISAGTNAYFPLQHLQYRDRFSAST